MRDCHSQSREQGHDGWHAQPGRPQGLYACNETPERAPRGHLLGGGHPKRELQKFHDAFVSGREDQSDTASDSDSDTEVEEWNDIIAYNTETSRYTTVADRDHRIVCDHHRTNKRRHHEWCLGYGKTKRLSLLIFRDSTSDNAITYHNWRSEVDNYVQEGHSPKLIRDSVLYALEGCPHYTAKTAMDDRDGSLHSIMEVLDSVYGGATTYSALMNKLNTIQQGNREAAKDYYECVVQLRVKLQEFHHFMFRPGDLEYHTKNAFFNGLHPEYQAMVVHKRDNPQASITQLLMRLNTAGVDGRSTPKHTPNLRANPPTEPTTWILISDGQITTSKTRHVTANRITTAILTSPSTPHKWTLLWRFKPKRTTSDSTSIMTMPCRIGTMRK